MGKYTNSPRKQGFRKTQLNAKHIHGATYQKKRMLHTMNMPNIKVGLVNLLK
jgi:hypothetical protein